MNETRSRKRKSSWEWYGVKLLYECIISGKPTPDKIDENNSSDHKTYEESIIIIKAQSFDHAYTLTERKAKEAEIDYYNPYDEKVEWRFVKALDAFNLFEELKQGTEVYSRFVEVPNSVSISEFISNFYPEIVVPEDNEPDYNFILRIREFNAIPGAKKR